MIVKWTNDDVELIKGYIGSDYAPCLYLYMDLIEYGPDSDFTKTWIQKEDGNITSSIIITENTKFEGFKGPMALLLGGVVKKMDKDYKNNGKIKWNFTKFLIDRDGNIVARFEPTEDMKKVAAKVKELL